MFQQSLDLVHAKMGFPDSSVDKEFACSVGDPGSIPGSGRSPGEGNSYLLQCPGLENSMDCIDHEVAKRVGHNCCVYIYIHTYICVYINNV